MIGRFIVSAPRAEGAVRGVMVLALVASVAACSSSGGSTGGDGDEGPTLGDFDTAFAAAQGLVPTSDMRTAGQANYSGAVQLDLVDAESTPVGSVIGDLSLSVDFDQELEFGQPDNFRVSPVTGSISNITGQTTSGDTIVWTGDLTSEDGLSDSFVSVITDTITAPGVGDITTQIGVLSTYFGNEVTVASDELTYEGGAYVVISGSFTGSTGTGIWGQAQVFLTPDGAPSANSVFADFSGLGGFVVTED